MTDPILKHTHIHTLIHIALMLDSNPILRLLKEKDKVPSIKIFLAPCF